MTVYLIDQADTAWVQLGLPDVAPPEPPPPSLSPVVDIRKSANALADYMPNGHMFAAKNIYNSNFRQLLRGLAWELFTAQGYLTELENEYFPDTTTLFLSEWEQALGIPDDCFSGGGTLIERRRDIIVKMSLLSVQTLPEFVALAAVFNVVVTILAGNDPLVVPAITPIRNARYTIVVQYTAAYKFPYTFPLHFGSEAIANLKCIFEKIKPANCQVLFQSI